MSNSIKKPRPRTGAERMAAYRARMRAKGLVPKTVWVYDTSDPGFIADARRQAAAVAAHDPAGDQWMAFLDAGGRAWPEE